MKSLIYRSHLLNDPATLRWEHKFSQSASASMIYRIRGEGGKKSSSSCLHFRACIYKPGKQQEVRNRKCLIKTTQGGGGERTSVNSFPEGLKNTPFFSGLLPYTRTLPPPLSCRLAGLGTYDQSRFISGLAIYFLASRAFFSASPRRLVMHRFIKNHTRAVYYDVLLRRKQKTMKYCKLLEASVLSCKIECLG